jgi:hypothetical protein
MSLHDGNWQLWRCPSQKCLTGIFRVKPWADRPDGWWVALANQQTSWPEVSTKPFCPLCGADLVAHAAGSGV